MRYGGGLSILRDLEIQALDHSEVLTVLGHQREPLLDRDGRNKRIKDVEAVRFRVPFEEFVGSRPCGPPKRHDHVR